MGVEVAARTAAPASPPAAAGGERALTVQVRKTHDSGSRGKAERFTLDVAFTAAPGITILFGPSGSGKTTVLQCIAGLARPDEGRIVAGDRVFFDAAGRIDLAVARRRIGYLFQNLALFPHLTVRSNVEYGLGHLNAEAKAARIDRILESFRIAHLRGRRPAEISGGERQRVALARALVTEPCVLLLDEPLSALDNATKTRIIDDLRLWNEHRSIPILYVTHGRREVFALGERVLFLEHGKVLAEGTPQEVMEAPRHETIAQIAGFENMFDAEVIATHEDHGTMTCRIEGTPVELEVRLARFTPGEKLRVAIRAGDILLATERPRGLSARNVIPGRVVSVIREGAAVNTLVDCGTLMHVALTPSGADALRLEKGHNVWLVMKTYSCHLVRPKSADRKKEPR
jgi:molybdate transport system ATP-binding protein